MASFPEPSSSLSYTSPSYVSNGSSCHVASGSGCSNGTNGGLETGANLEHLCLSKLSSSLERLLLDTEFDSTDTEIEVDGMIVKVHRCILAARSNFFLELFLRKGDESGCTMTAQGKYRYSMDKLISCRHISYEAFKDFLWYIYTGKLRTPDPDASRCADLECAHDACGPAINIIVEMMYVSYTFQIEELILLLKRRLRDFVEKAYVEDIIPILLVAFHSSLDELTELCVQRIARSNLDAVSIQKEFPYEVVKKIKSVHCKNIPDELVDTSEFALGKRAERIYKALDSDDVELVKMLLSESDVTLNDVNALHYTAAYSDPKVVAEILELGLVTVNLKNSRGYTPLHVAAMRREPSVIVSLLRKGALASEVTGDGRSVVTVCRRLTRLKDYNARTEQGKELNKDRMCVDLLELDMRRSIMHMEELSTSSSLADNLQADLEYLENRVALAKIFFPTQAKLALQIAETESKRAFRSSHGSFHNLKEVDLNETPEMQAKRLRLKMDALKRTVDLGKRYFPNCYQVVDRLMEDERSELFVLDQADPYEHELKRKRYFEIREDVLKAFTKDNALNGMPFSTSLLSKGDKKRSRIVKK